MRFFVCLIDEDGAPCSEPTRRAYEAAARAHGLSMRWHNVGSVSVLTAEDSPDASRLLADSDGHVAVGMVRLDNRAEVARWAGCRPGELSDLELVLRLIVLHGIKRVPDLLGDFAFIIWTAATRSGLAACDVFAVRKLYYAIHGSRLAFASRAEALALREEYDTQYLAETVGYCPPSGNHTPYTGVHSLPPATTAVVERGRLVTPSRYWTVQDFEPASPRASAESQLIETGRALLAEAVRTRLTGRLDTWSQLSGGMDSSSIVSVAEWLTETEAAPAGLAGTVTYVDTHGTGADERPYSKAVVDRFQLRNELIADRVIWEDDQLGPPRLDHPSAIYPYYARDRQLCDIVRGAGGQVLLTGQGGDELFAGNMFFFADSLAHGHVRVTLRDMARRAAIGRVSFWELAYRNAALPLLPAVIQRRMIAEAGQVPPWVTPATVRRYKLSSSALTVRSYAGRIGRKYGDAVAAIVAAIPAKVITGVIEDALDVRHPYLYRPLVEFALRLPPELCVRPYARKWLLREAMRGILPEPVRTRIGKGVMNGLLAWSLVNQKTYLEPLVCDPILAQLGLIDPDRLRAAFAAAQHERDGNHKLSPDVQHTLAIEAWLRVRSGRWGRGAHVGSRTTRNQFTSPQYEGSAGRHV